MRGSLVLCKTDNPPVPGNRTRGAAPRRLHQLSSRTDTKGTDEHRPEGVHQALPEMRGTDHGQLDGGELLNVLRKVFGDARGEARREKPVVRQAWDGHPDEGGTMYVEVPPGVWMKARPWMYEAYDVRLDPFMCDPDPDDLEKGA